MYFYIGTKKIEKSFNHENMEPAAASQPHSFSGGLGYTEKLLLDAAVGLSQSASCAQPCSEFKAELTWSQTTESKQ